MDTNNDKRMMKRMKRLYTRSEDKKVSSFFSHIKIIC